MTIKELETHIGSLIHIKTQLYWYGVQGWDENSDRFCILLDSKSISSPEGGRFMATCALSSPKYVLQLLIDDEPWWVAACDDSYEIVE